MLIGLSLITFICTINGTSEQETFMWKGNLQNHNFTKEWQLECPKEHYLETNYDTTRSCNLVKVIVQF